MRDRILPLVLILWQYLQVAGRLHGADSICLVLFCIVRVEARTRQSDRFLFRRRPKITVLLVKCRVPLDLPRICQFLVTMSLIGGFWGL